MAILISKKLIAIFFSENTILTQIFLILIETYHCVRAVIDPHCNELAVRELQGHGTRVSASFPFEICWTRVTKFKALFYDAIVEFSVLNITAVLHILTSKNKRCSTWRDLQLFTPLFFFCFYGFVGGAEEETH